MTTAVLPGIASFGRRVQARLRTVLNRRGERPTRLPASPAQRALSLALAMVSGVLLVLIVNLALVSQLQHMTSQTTLYHQLRLSLAQGATPIGPLTADGGLVALGTPVAVMNAPKIGIGHEVIVSGTSSAQTMVGIGHRIDTALPCQVGTAVLYARSGSYGAVGQAWSHLQNGDRFDVTMGQGTCTYQVTGQRLAGATAPAPPTGKAGALTLVTATGPAFMPTGVLRVDTTLVSTAFDRPSVTFPTGALPASHREFGSDGTQMLPLILLLELLIAIVIGAMISWRRWNRLKTAIVFVPIGIAIVLMTTDTLDHLIPNLL